MSKPIVLCLGNTLFAQDAWKKLEEIAEVVTLPKGTSRATFFQLIEDPASKFSKIEVITRTAGSVAQTGRFDEELARRLPKSVKAVCHNGAGYDQVDVKYFNDRHIQVSNTPDLVSNSTADDHVFLLLGALRNFSFGARNLLDGKWPQDGSAAGTPFGHDPEGKTVGVLGLGGIGGAIVSRLKPFGFKKFIYHNRSRLSPELENDCEYVSFDELLSQSDIISVNVPLNPKTVHLIDSKAFGKMKEGVVIVNTARGAIIDEAALIEALKAGKVRSAGLDVFEFEPKVCQEIMDMKQVLALPHMGAHSVETRKKMEEFVVSNAASVIKTGHVISIVPEIRNEEWFKTLA
ncbi:glyoxylate reductase [Monosporozyma unispora]|nr:glyoxylate reductase [Kazachstania unispora]